MDFIYLTAKKYPGKTADHFFIKEAANAFGKLLKDGFLLILDGNSSNHFSGIRTLNAGLGNERGRTLYYFFWLMLFIIRGSHNSPRAVFYSNDPNLLSNLIFLRKIFRFKYRVCSEWHMLFNDWRDPLIAKNSDFLVTTSQRLKNIIIGRFEISAEKIFTAYGGVNIGNYENPSPRTELNLPEGKKLVAYVGLFRTMGMEKGIDVMIKSLPFLPEEVIMLFVGGLKDEIAFYKNVAESLGVADRCIFIEKQDPRLVPAYELAADILVIPYPNEPHFRDYGFPMKAYEYMASKKPVIYSDLELLSEVFSDCAYGFKPGNSKDLAEKIISILSGDKVLIRQRSELCYAKAERFSWKNRSCNIADFLGNKN